MKASDVWEGIWFQTLGLHTEKVCFTNCIHVLTTNAMLVVEHSLITH